MAESARAGLRELDRLEAAADKGAALTADLDVRSRLPDTLEAALRTPTLTPRRLAQRLRVTPQAATRLLARSIPDYRSYPHNRYSLFPSKFDFGHLARVDGRLPWLGGKAAGV